MCTYSEYIITIVIIIPRKNNIIDLLQVIYEDSLKNGWVGGWGGGVRGECIIILKNNNNMKSDGGSGGDVKNQSLESKAKLA